jgi:hypothetical protein
MKYKNRYGDIIECVKLDDNHYELKAMLNLGQIEHVGIGNKPSEFVEFYGGPMIYIGDDLGTWYEELKGKIVKKISTTEGVVLEV